MLEFLNDVQDELSDVDDDKFKTATLYCLFLCPRVKQNMRKAVPITARLQECAEILDIGNLPKGVSTTVGQLIRAKDEHDMLHDERTALVKETADFMTHCAIASASGPECE